MARFLVALIITAAAIALAAYAGFGLGYFDLPSFFFPTLALLTLFTGIIYRYLDKADSPQFFLQLYLLTMVIKLLAYGVYNLLMILKDVDSAIENVVFFMATYFIFTALEIGFLYRKIISRNTPGSRPKNF